MAWVGQAHLQSPQRIHSKSLACFTGSQPMPQTLAHFPQETQASASTRYRTRETGLNRLYTAPSGQRYLQKGR